MLQLVAFVVVVVVFTGQAARRQLPLFVLLFPGI
jgi:hypothetical protein